MLFTFAGSSHSKYVTYLLETITTLELEASAELRDAILRSMLVNIDGHSGTFCALDFMQEYFNRLLEAIVQRKGIDYGAPYIRTVIARNLHHLGQIKKGFREGFGLQPRSGHHNAPHTRPEVRLSHNLSSFLTGDSSDGRRSPLVGPYQLPHPSLTVPQYFVPARAQAYSRCNRKFLYAVAVAALDMLSSCKVVH